MQVMSSCILPHSAHTIFLRLNQHRRILPLTACSRLARIPRARRSGPNPLIQTNRHSIHRINLAIKGRLKVSMRTQTLLDESAPTPARPKRQTLKPPYISVVEEHVPHRHNALVDLVRVAGENDALGDDAIHAGRKRGACADELEVGRRWRVGRGRLGGALEVEERDVAPG